MITLKIVLNIHEQVLNFHGGARGIRDINGFKSAIARPFQTFDGIDLYPTIIEKAAAIFESIIINHPFLDGNKRTAFVLLEYLLRLHLIEISINEELIYQFVINTSTGTIHFDNIVLWLKENTSSTI